MDVARYPSIALADYYLIIYWSKTIITWLQKTKIKLFSELDHSDFWKELVTSLKCPPSPVCKLVAELRNLLTKNIETYSMSVFSPKDSEHWGGYSIMLFLNLNNGRDKWMGDIMVGFYTVYGYKRSATGHQAFFVHSYKNHSYIVVK